MNNEKMPRMNISLTKQQMDQLKELSKKENRKYSQQIVHMMEFYIENKDRR